MMILQSARANLSSGDQCSLDLPFAATKSLTARIGPTPVFTRASTATFVGSDGLIQSAAVNAARFDHDPITLACKGLLIEESRTNLLARSEEFNQAVWQKLRVSITADAVASPFGTNLADKLIEDSMNSTHLLYRLINSGSLSAHTFSVFAKAGERDFVFLHCADNFAANSSAYFNLSTGTLGTVGAGATASIVPLNNGWYRCSITATTTSTANNGVYIQPAAVNGSASYTGDGTSGIYIWGAQLEAGSFATSYIPTTTASVVRSADVCSITGSAFTSFWNRFAGTCVVGVGSSLGSAPRFVSNLAATRAVEIYGVANIDFYEASGGQEVRIASSVTYPNKLGLAYAINDYQSAYNGVLGGSDTNTGGTIPNATELHIGNLGGTSNRLTGHIQSIRYFKKRLSNQKLQTLTAP